jgi:hypothetical protein
LNGELIVGGYFTRAGGVAAVTIAAWTGALWHPLGDGTSAEVTALAVYNGAIVAAGGFTQAGGAAANFVASWDGTAWSALGSGTDYPILALAVFDGKLIAGGGFGMAGGVPASCIAQWDGNAWSSLGTGVGGWVYALTVWNGALVAGGEFGSAGGVLADHIALWDGTSWSAVGGGTNHYVRALASYGGDLYAAGSFSVAGGTPAYIIARWDGTAWSALGSGLSTTIHYAYVRSLATHDGALFAGGAFTLAGGAPAGNIARWDGTSWSALGTGVEAPGVSGSPYAEVWAMTSYNGQLVVTGDFMSAGTVAASGIARWNGSGWSSLGSGLDWGALALVSSGTQLSAGGYFENAGGKPSRFIASWSEASVSVPATSDSPLAGGPRLSSWPSPFKERATFEYVLPRAGAVRLAVYDVSGARVATLVEHSQKEGEHSMEWSGRRDHGGVAPPGVYYVELTTPEGVAQRRIVRIR